VTDAILYSGGLDSLLLRLRFPEALLLRVEYGQTYSAAERMAIYSQAGIDRRVPLTVGCQLPEAAEDGHVPHRNLALAVLGAAWTGADRVLLGGVRGETSLDKSRRFLHAASRALTRSEGPPVALCAPLAGRTKSEHLRDLVRSQGVVAAQKLLDCTTSCYAAEWDGAEIGCGLCLACFRKWVAVTNAGLAARFATDPACREINRRDAVYLLRAPLREWPGIIENHWDARRALSSVH
jgi:7-cyano-7-deazaguanine synthase in queuosine biosynthesis